MPPTIPPRPPGPNPDPDDCDTCSGAKVVILPNHKIITCPTCNGSGKK